MVPSQISHVLTSVDVVSCRRRLARVFPHQRLGGFQAPLALHAQEDRSSLRLRPWHVLRDADSEEEDHPRGDRDRRKANVVEVEAHGTEPTSPLGRSPGTPLGVTVVALACHSRDGKGRSLREYRALRSPEWGRQGATPVTILHSSQRNRRDAKPGRGEQAQNPVGTRTLSPSQEVRVAVFCEGGSGKRFSDQVAYDSDDQTWDAFGRRLARLSSDPMGQPKRREHRPRTQA